MSCPVPVIKGKARAGHRLRAVIGAVSPGDSTLRYQWLRKRKAIKHADRRAYKVRSKDRGAKLRVRLTCSRPGLAAVVTVSRPRRIH